MLTKTRKTNVYLVTYNINKNKDDVMRTQKNAHAVTYQIKAKSVNNPFSKNFLGSFKVSEKI